MNIFKKLGEQIADLAELNVQTFTGNIETVLADPVKDPAEAPKKEEEGKIEKAKKGSVINWIDLVNHVKEKKTEGTIQLVASTQIQFDGDANMYFAEKIDPELLKAHMAAIESGQKVRQGLVDTFKSAIGLPVS